MTVYSCIKRFKRKVGEGAHYTCCLCNGIVDKKSVLKLNANDYSVHARYLKYATVI